jgi:hypothetical protein
MGRAGRHIKAGDPHGADEHQTQLAVRVLELLVQVLLEHPLPMPRDIETLLLEVFDLVLALAHNHGHIRGLHQTDAGDQHLTGVTLGLRQIGLEPVDLRFPVLLHLVVHPHGSGLVDADHHGLAAVATTGEVRHHILGDRLQAIFPRDDVVFTAELAFELFLLRLIQLCVFEQALQVAVEVVVGELNLRDTVLVVQRHRRAVLDGTREVVDAHVFAEHLARALLLALDQWRAGEAQKAGIR